MSVIGEGFGGRRSEGLSRAVYACVKSVPSGAASIGNGHGGKAHVVRVRGHGTRNLGVTGEERVNNVA